MVAGLQGEVVEMTTALDEMLICPFGIEARFCQHQETLANDLPSAMRAKLTFICKLDKLEDCPKMSNIFNDISGWLK